MLSGFVFAFFMSHFSSLLLFCKSWTPHKLIHNFSMMHGSRKTIMSSFKHRRFHSFSFVILLSLFLSSSFCRIFLMLLPVSGDTQASESTETSWSLHPKAPASDASSYGRQPTPSTGLVMCRCSWRGLCAFPLPTSPYRKWFTNILVGFCCTSAISKSCTSAISKSGDQGSCDGRRDRSYSLFATCLIHVNKQIYFHQVDGTGASGLALAEQVTVWRLAHIDANSSL